jgi:hypothetical protein
MSAQNDLMEPASTVYEAALVEHLGWRDRAEGAIVPGLTDELMAEEASTVDLVVRRKDDGTELIRTPADLASPDALLIAAQTDLDSMSEAQFKREWRMPTRRGIRQPR